MIVVFAFMVGAPGALGHGLLRLPGIVSLLDSWGRWIAPFVLIGLGAYVFLEAETLTWLLRVLGG